MRRRTRARLTGAVGSVGSVLSSTVPTMIGRSVARLLRWTGVLGQPDRPEPDDVDRLRGAVLLLASPIFVVSVPIGALCTVLGWQLPRLVARRNDGVRLRALDDEVVLAVELLAVSSQSGATVPRAVVAVAPHLAGPLGPAFREAAETVDQGGRVDAALVDLGGRIGEPVLPLVSLLRSAHLDGDPLVPALDRLATRLRAEQRGRSEAEARRLSTRLVLPLVGCTLPGFVLVGIAPVVVDALHHAAR